MTKAVVDGPATTFFWQSMLSVVPFFGAVCFVYFALLSFYGMIKGTESY